MMRILILGISIILFLIIVGVFIVPAAMGTNQYSGLIVLISVVVASMIAIGLPGIIQDWKRAKKVRAYY